MLTPHAIPGYLAVRVKLSPPAARDLNFTPHAGCPGSPAQYSSLDCSETTFIGRIYRSSCFWSRSPASCLSGDSSRSGSSGRCFCSPSCSEVRTVSRLRVEHCTDWRLLQQSTEPFRATPGRATLSSSLPSKLRAGSAFTRSLTSEFEVVSFAECTLTRSTQVFVLPWPAPGGVHHESHRTGESRLRCGLGHARSGPLTVQARRFVMDSG